ncbi:unnamed protein product, partial [Candidula unifasciata]
LCQQHKHGPHLHHHRRGHWRRPAHLRLHLRLHHVPDPQEETRQETGSCSSEIHTEERPRDGSHQQLQHHTVLVQTEQREPGHQT